MDSNLEYSQSTEVKEVSAPESNSENLTETEETADNFDDCGVDESTDPTSDEVVEEDDDFDDCGVDDETKLDNVETTEEEDDFDDCGIDSDGPVVDQTVEPKVETEETHFEDPKSEEAIEEPQESVETPEAEETVETEDAPAEIPESEDDVETAEKSEEPMETTEESEAPEEVTENPQEPVTEEVEGSPEADSEAAPEADETPVEASAGETEIDGTVETTEESETPEEVTEEPQEPVTEEVSQIESEAAPETEEAPEADSEVAPEAEDAPTEVSDEETEPEAAPDTDEAPAEVSDEEAEVDGTVETEETPVEATEDPQEPVTEEVEEAPEADSDPVSDEKTETDGSIEKTEEAQEKEATLEERVESALSREDVTASEINSLKEEHQAALDEKINERSAVEDEAKEKFQEVCSKESGTDEFKQSLQVYNGLHDQKELLNEQISSMEKQQTLLEEKSQELNENSLEKKLEEVEPSRWAGHSLEEKKEIIGETGKLIAADLGIKNMPEVRYYNNPNEYDYGGFSASQNSIYINEYNLHDGKEAIDTIAHELRHCHQHERAENPQTEQDRIFRENFENYKKPELNFEEYRNQPVEVDARQYAESITAKIPNSSGEYNRSVQSAEDSKGASYSALNPEKGAVFDKSELPSDFEHKVSETSSGEQIFKSIMDPVYRDPNLTIEEKVEKGLDVLKDINDKTNMNIVNNPRAIMHDETSVREGVEGGYLKIAFGDYHGLDPEKGIGGIVEKDESGNYSDVNIPKDLFRRGKETGNNLTTYNEDGTIPDENQLSIPYEENLEAWHKYDANPEGYKEAIDIIKNNNISAEDCAAKLNELKNSLGGKGNAFNTVDVKNIRKEYERFQEQNHTQQCRACGADSTYGVCGVAAPMYAENNPQNDKLYDGGAPQFNPPLPTKVFTRMGVFKEVPMNEKERIS